METVSIYLGLVITRTHHRVAAEQVELEAITEVTVKILSLVQLKVLATFREETLVAVAVAPALHGPRLLDEAVLAVSELFGGRIGHSRKMRRKEKTWKTIT